MSSNLFLLKELSVRIGKDASLIQSSGGNTSIKENGLIWIKASGKKLRNALDDNIFVCFDLEDLRKELANRPKSENLKIKNLCGSNLRASIETSLHVQIVNPVVIHTHSIDAIACSMFLDAREYIEKSLKEINWKWIPYSRPGFPLAKEIKKAQGNKNYNVLILENHGLVISANTINEAETLQRKVTERLKQKAREIKPADLIKLTHILKKIPNARLPKDEVIHSLGTDPWSFNLAKRNPHCPDHIVFCGKYPWIVNNLLPPNSEVAYGIIKDVGVILLKNATSTIEEMLKAQAEILLRIPPNKKVNLLNDEECDEIINWESEKYRKKIDKYKCAN